MQTETQPTPAAHAVAKGNFFLDNPDLQFYFKKGVDWASIVPDREAGFTEPDGFKNLQEALEMYEETLKLSGGLAGTEIAGRAREVDLAQVTYEDGEAILSAPMRENLARAKEMGVLAPDMPRAVGGWNFPLTVVGMMVEMLSRACPATMTEFGFYEAPARLIHLFGSDELKARFLEPLCKGDLSGSICITEADAGSDVGNIKCAATNKDGRWYVTGRKQFISNGGGEVAVVVCRTDPKSNGLTGLSLMVVPRFVERDGRKVRNFEVARVEHKLSIRGSATCELAFEGSEAYLLGKEGAGFDLILHFMNEGRVAVGLQTLGVIEAAYRTALAFARERVTMGKPIWKHELVADMLVDMETEAQALRAGLYAAYEAQDREAAIEARLKKVAPDSPEAVALKARKKELSRFERALTPLVKFYGAERCVEATRKALQIHGGYGVIVDYDAERLYRDAPVFAIYEGTSQIQALMSLKDTLKSVMVAPGKFAKEMLKAWWSRKFAGDSLKRKLSEVDYQWKRSLFRVAMAIRRDLSKVSAPGLDIREKFARLAEARDGFNALNDAFLRAERLCWLASFATFGRILAEQAVRFPERRAIAERYLSRRVPEARMHAEAIAFGDRSALDWIKAHG